MPEPTCFFREDRDLRLIPEEMPGLRKPLRLCFPERRREIPAGDCSLASAMRGEGWRSICGVRGKDSLDSGLDIRGAILGASFGASLGALLGAGLTVGGLGGDGRTEGGRRGCAGLL